MLKGKPNNYVETKSDQEFQKDMEKGFSPSLSTPSSELVVDTSQIETSFYLFKLEHVNYFAQARV